MNRRFKGIRAVLFDFGGTLDSDGISWKYQFYPHYKSAGLPWDFGEFEKYFYASDDTLTEKGLKRVSYEDMLRKQVSLVLRAAGAYKKSLVDRVVRSYMKESLKTIRRNTALLRALKKKYRLGVVSNFYGNLPFIFKENGLSKIFDVVIDSGVVGTKKPEAEIFYCALKPLGMRPDESVFVGDSVSRDMHGARGVGMKHIWLSGIGSRIPGPCCPQDKVIYTLLDLKKVLL